MVHKAKIPFVPHWLDKTMSWTARGSRLPETLRALYPTIGRENIELQGDNEPKSSPIISIISMKLG